VGQEEERVAAVPRAASMAGLSFALGVLLVLGLLWATGQLGAALTAGFSYGQLPLLVVALLGWRAHRARWARALAVALLYTIGVGLAGATLAMAWLALGGEGAPRAAYASLAGLALVLLALLLLPAVLLVRPVRLALARLFPLEPDVFRHWLGLVALFWLVAIPLALLALLAGRPPLEALAAQAGAEALEQPSALELLYGLGWTLVLSLVAAGFPQARTLGAALARLGLTWPGWRWLAVGIVLSVAMVPLFDVVDRAASAIVAGFGLATTPSSWIERLFGRSVGIGGVVVAALAAGLGEEVVWRGLVQPRYGLLAAALGFSAMHGFQYGPDGLLSVFVSGLVLGLVRRWRNTTVAAVVHAGYDFWLLLGMQLHWW
jgi:membrane protease YdiL (CAAX protease family)